MSKIDPRLEFLTQTSREELGELEPSGHFPLTVESTTNPKTTVLVQFTGDMAPLQAAGLQAHTIAGDVAAGDIELNKIGDLQALDNVVRVESSRPVQTELDVSIAEIRANLVHSGSPPLNGEGVIVGIIDSGIDYTHRCFRKSDGTSRILFIWDQSLTPAGGESSPTGQALGVEYSKANIDAALASANPMALVRHQDRDTGHGHGTHVSGIAAGNGSVAGNGQAAGTFVGLAPQADIILVRNVTYTDAMGDSANTLAAVKYIFDKAAALDKPVVINLSQGDNLGPHDGTSLLERGIDNLLGRPGRSMVKSAGNAGNDDIHASGRVAAGGSETVQFTVPASDSVPDSLDIWYSGRDRFDITVTTPSGHTSASVSPGNSSTINLGNGNRVFIASRLPNPINQDNQIYLTLYRGTSATIEQGAWSFTLSGTTVTDGRFHAWIERGQTVPRFTGTHLDQNVTISVPGTSREVITVGSYVTKPGSSCPAMADLSVFSSHGPTRDGRKKPELTAPGEYIMSARAATASAGADAYHLLQGTSMSAPHVTGAVALVLQRHPRLTQRQIIDGLKATARSDTHTGTVPNNRWGHGKLDVKAAVDRTYPAVTSSNWVRIRPALANWPGGSPQPPSFTITANENGTAVIELAWDPERLLAPSTDYPDTRYYASSMDFNKTMTNDDGSSRTVRVAPQVIRLVNNRVVWTVPQALWDGYVQESLKSLRSPPTSEFRCNLYYRVRFQPTGGEAALEWPPNEAIQGHSDAPHMGILTISATPSSQVTPDQQAVQAMGGPPGLDNLWGDLLMLYWRFLDPTNAVRQSLERIFAHAVFRNELDVATRGKLLRLWLFTGVGARTDLYRLLDRRVPTSANTEQPALQQQDLKGSGTLLDNLLGLLEITPHPDIAVLHPQELVADVVQEVLDPNGQLNQGSADTCTTTVFQTMMIGVRPAEYVRLQRGLLDAAGSAELAGGATVTVPPAIFQVARYAGAQNSPFFIRTNAELAFQATLLKYGKGPNFPSYDPAADPNAPNGVNTVFQATMRGGLTRVQMDRVLEGLFGMTFTTSAVGTDPAVRDDFLQAMTNSRVPLTLGLVWSAARNQPNSAGHAVLALRYEGGRVFFKNPQYAGSSPPASATAGSSVNNPPRRYEDPGASLESIGDADLRDWLLWYHVPDRDLWS